MALGNFTTWGMEALTEFQEKIKSWVRSLVPAKTSQLVNDGTGRSPYATKAYVDSSSGGGGGIVYPDCNYGLGEWGHRTCAQKDNPDQKEFHGDREYILDWRPYLIDMTPVAGETEKEPVAELKRNNWLRTVDGEYAAVVGITSVQSTACNVQLYWSTGGGNPISSEFYDSGAFKPATFWEYCKDNLQEINATYGTDYGNPIEVVLYTGGGTALRYGAYDANHIVAPWETTSTMLSVFIGREKDCYLIDGVVGNSGKRWHGITEEPVEFDGIDPSEFRLARTGMSPGPVTGKCINSKWVTRSFFYNYPAGTTWNAGVDMSAACNGENMADCNTSYKYCNSFFNNGHYPWVECTWSGSGYGGGSRASSNQNSEQYSPNAYTAQKYNRQNNAIASSPAPVAEGGYHLFNTFMNTMEVGYGTKFLHANTMFSPGISSDFDCADEATYRLNGGIKYTSGSTVNYRKWSDTSAVNSSYNWSDAVNSYKGKFQCMEPQIALSIAVETGVAPGASFRWNGGVWRYDLATPVDDVEYPIISPADGEMNCRIYKEVNFTYNGTTYYMNLVCGLVQGVNYGGDIWSYWQGGIEIVANPVLGSSMHKSSKDRIDVFLEPNQSKWHTEDLGSSYSSSWWYRSFGTFFGFETTYKKVATGVSYSGYTRERAPYAPIALEYIAGFNPDGDALQVGWRRGECYYANQNYDDWSTTGVGGYHTRRAVRFRGTASSANSSPRWLNATNRAAFVYVSYACSAQVLLAQPQ